MKDKLDIKALAGIIRLPFLLLAPVCVFLAAGLASSMTEGHRWLAIGVDHVLRGIRPYRCQCAE